jgi:hypothetical protein
VEFAISTEQKRMVETARRIGRDHGIDYWREPNRKMLESDRLPGCLHPADPEPSLQNNFFLQNNLEREHEEG